MTLLNETHDPSLRSWVASANAAGNDFPLQNLPFAVFRRNGSGEAFSRPLKKCSSNAPGSWISKKRVVQTRLRSECEGHFGLFAGRFARFGRTYPMAHA